VDNAMWRQKLTSYFLMILAAVALVLCMAGVFGVVTHMLARQRREIGIRLALGAQAADVSLLAMRRGMAAPLLGALIGLGLAPVLGRSMESLLYGVSKQDGFTLFLAFTSAMAAALIACLTQLGAIRRIRPSEALRYE